MVDKRRVLIVEDEILIGLLLEEMIEAVGFEVAATVHKLDQAIAADPESYNLAILDVNLGTTPVFPFADRLASRGIPFAFVTGNGGADIPEAHRGAPLLQKPFRQQLLANTLSALAQRAADSPNAQT